MVVEAKGDGLVAATPDDSLVIEMYIYISDAEGRIRDFLSQVVSLDAKNRGAGLSDRGLKYYGDLVLAPGNYLVRVLVRNSETGRSGVESVPLRPQPCRRSDDRQSHGQAAPCSTQPVAAAGGAHPPARSCSDATGRAATAVTTRSSHDRSVATGGCCTGAQGAR